jgi:hypothetical protein
MELYTLDPLYRRQYVIDRFVSLIWTERWQTFGDFQLTIHSTYQSRSLLKPDTWLAMNRSNYVMRVESFEDGVDGEGNKLLVIKGRSIERILIDRVAKDHAGDLTSYPQWTITNSPAAVGRKIFHDICVTGILDTADIIPGIVEGTFMAASTIAEPADSITVDLKPDTVYSAIGTNILAPWDLGMRILRQDSTGQLYFDIYAGSDRTTAQTTLAPVVFAPQLDNLQNTKELTTIDTAKNVAYVFSPDGFEKVYPVGVDPTTDGFERRVLLVDASDITTSTTSDVPTALIQRGNEQLAASRTFFGFDGEVSQDSQYQYGTDYNLGDVVEVQNTDGVASDMRVTEQIFIADGQGERSYPTLVTRIVINTGSWLSWNSNKAWFDLDADTTDVWSNQP